LKTQGAVPLGGLGNLRDKDVLCLAGGGGQQAAAFGLLGAKVTVFDLSETQLQRDEMVAAHYGFRLNKVQGDMRDLSQFGDDSFDIVWHPYSINFVPDSRVVFEEVARILRPGGYYRVEFANPYVAGIDETDWDGRGYPLRQPYEHGAELVFSDPHWDFVGEDGAHQSIVGPREFRHTLGITLSSLLDLGFLLLAFWEGPPGGDANAQPGTWEHFIAIAPPWLGLWLTFRPDLLHDLK